MGIYRWNIEFSETPEKAVQRVVEEKTGLSVLVDKPLYTWGFTVGEVCSVGIAFECTSQSEEVILAEDLNDFKWVTKEELSEVITNQAVLKDIEKAGLTNQFTLDDFGKVDLFIEPMD